MTLIVRPSTVAEIEGSPNFSEILEEYAQESSIKGLPHPLAKMEAYRQLEAAGVAHCFAAFLDDTLVGILVLLSPIIPHYSQIVAVVESYFVFKTQRKTGAGLSLRRMAEDKAKELGAVGILFSAPIGGVLAEVLENTKEYTETNRVFFRGLSE